MKLMLALVALLAAAPVAAQTPLPSPTPLSVFVIDVPFTDCHNLICVRAAVNSKGLFTFLFDTSNARSAVDTASAQTMGLHLDPYLGRNGQPVSGVFKTAVPAVLLGDMSMPSVDAIAVDFNTSLKPVGLHVDGSLAYPLFKDRVVQINYPDHTLRISQPMTTTWACAFHCAAMKLVTFGKAGPPVLTSTFIINGKTVTAQIDTSFEGTMLVYPQAVGSLGLTKVAQHTTPRVFPVTDGGVTMLAGHARSMGFQSEELGGSAPAVYFATKGVHVPDGMFEATVGNALFKNMIVTLDFHDMVISINPASTKR